MLSGGDVVEFCCADVRLHGTRARQLRAVAHRRFALTFTVVQQFYIAAAATRRIVWDLAPKPFTLSPAKRYCSFFCRMAEHYKARCVGPRHHNILPPVSV